MSMYHMYFFSLGVPSYGIFSDFSKPYLALCKICPFYDTKNMKMAISLVIMHAFWSSMAHFKGLIVGSGVTISKSVRKFFFTFL